MHTHNLLRLEAKIQARNGRVFLFSLWNGNITVDCDNRPHMEILDVTPETFLDKVDSFMTSWDDANPR